MQNQVNTDNKVPRHVVAKLFFGAYLSPFVLGTALVLIMSGFNAVGVIFMVPYLLVLFPTGLFGLVSTSNGPASLGYVVYALVFLLAFKFRRPLQTCYLFGLLLILIVFNLMGCREVASHASERMTLP